MFTFDMEKERQSRNVLPIWGYLVVGISVLNDPNRAVSGTQTLDIYFFFEG
jgi:hypothetical protein